MEWEDFHEGRPREPSHNSIQSKCNAWHFAYSPLPTVISHLIIAFPNDTRGYLKNRHARTLFMLYLILGIVCLGLFAAALFFFLRSNELSTQIKAAQDDWRLKEDDYTSELAKLEKIRHIPNVVEKARRTQAEVEAKLAEADRAATERVSDANRRAEEIVHRALAEAQDRSQQIKSQAETLKSEATESLRLAKWQAQNALDEAQKEAKDLASKARKDTKEKRDKAESTLEQAIAYALEIRQKADHRATEIAGEAYEAKGKLRDYEAAIHAIENRIKKYDGVFIIPATHLLDELAGDFGFQDAGTRLKLARERTKRMQENGTAATCGYSEGWKKEHALKFVLGTFNGKIDTILSRLKPGNQGKLLQEIKDAYAIVNLDGEVYKNARIQEEYLDARLDEVKWGVAVLKIKEKSREEQRAIREQIREEQKAKKEIEKAIKQAVREEELVNKAIAKLRKQFEEASDAERAKLDLQIMELGAKLAEAEEKGKKAISMAQQTKQGHVYIISNLGSFGENVYKIGLTRRIDPTERVRELSDASVPFPFDVHAMLKSDDAPALETILHRRFVERQVNKVNRRKEFFKVSLKELREVIDELGIDCTWTLEYEASQYRETQALEEAMRSNSGLRKQWLEEQATFKFDDQDFEDAEHELEDAEA
ncbi:GIY-YIG nuclease family protein [Singulisphaera rosea]